MRSWPAAAYNLGRDVFVRVVYGTRISLLVGVLSTLLAVAVGVVVGLVAGYLGGAVDTVLARFIDVVLSFPFLLFAIALVSIVGPSLTVSIGVIAFFSWAAVGRVLRFLLRRLAFAVLVLWLISVAVFALFFVAPQDPARLIAGRLASPQTLDLVRHRLGLDQPIPDQYLHFLGGLLHGDLGYSYYDSEPVTSLIAARLPVTASLTLGEDYVRTARAKGLTERRVVYRNGLRSALTTQLGIDIGTLLGGAIVTESVFGLPGLGQLAVQSVTTQDLPVIVGLVLVAAAFIVVANILVDAAYAVLDPRVRLA